MRFLCSATVGKNILDNSARGCLQSEHGISRLADLWRVPIAERDRRFLMIVGVYEGYMDESGTHDGSDVVAVAGYLSTYGDWTRWEEEWNPLMHHYCVKDWHMSDFEGRYREFDCNNYWIPEIRNRLIERVTTVCQQRTIIGLGCAVIREQYEGILTDKIQGDLRHPYYFCLYACLNMLLNWNENPRLEAIKPVNFLFDQKKGRFRVGDAMIGWEAHALDFFQRIKSGLDPEGKILGSLAFGDRRVYPQLRAADLIVYEAAKEARRLWNDPSRPIRKSLEVLRKDYNLLITFPTAKQMRNFVRVIETSVDAMNRGASDEEQEALIRELQKNLE
jgi:hypothetical protein